MRQSCSRAAGFAAAQFDHMWSCDRRASGGVGTVARSDLRRLGQLRLLAELVQARLQRAQADAEHFRGEFAVVAGVFQSGLNESFIRLAHAMSGLHHDSAASVGSNFFT